MPSKRVACFKPGTELKKLINRAPRSPPCRRSSSAVEPFSPAPTAGCSSDDRAWLASASGVSSRCASPLLRAGSGQVMAVRIRPAIDHWPADLAQILSVQDFGSPVDSSSGRGVQQGYPERWICHKLIFVNTCKNCIRVARIGCIRRRLADGEIPRHAHRSGWNSKGIGWRALSSLFPEFCFRPSPNARVSLSNPFGGRTFPPKTESSPFSTGRRKPLSPLRLRGGAISGRQNAKI